MTGRPFTCARCKAECLARWTEEEALAEAEELFGFPIPEQDRRSLCDDCYGEFLLWFRSLSPAEHRQIREEETAA